MPSPVASAGASFQLGDASNVLTELADQLSVITPESDTEEYNASVFSPGSTLPVKYKGYGATERTYTLRGVWNQTLDTFFESISGLTGRSFQYGPEGTASGKRKVTGTVNVSVWNGNGEQSAEGGFLPFEIELSVVTRTVSTF